MADKQKTINRATVEQELSRSEAEFESLLSRYIFWCRFPTLGLLIFLFPALLLAILLGLGVVSDDVIPPEVHDAVSSAKTMIVATWFSVTFALSTMWRKTYETRLDACLSLERRELPPVPAA